MLTTNWQPFAEMNRISREMDRLFSDTARSAFRGGGGNAFPAMNVWDDQENVYAETEIPGYALDQLEVLLDGNTLTIRGESKPCENEGGRWLRRERRCTSFSRSFEIPCALEDDRVEARLENGVLFLTMPKAEASRPRRIEVKPG